MSLSDDVKSLAFEVGFHAVGITGVEPFTESERALRERYDRGLLEGSGYDSDVIRLYAHPRESLHTARSIISVALSYLTDESSATSHPHPNPLSPAGEGTPDRQSVTSQPRGWMARFSRGLDYHQALQERLFALAGAIQTKLGRRIEVRSFADTGTLADRSVAIRAGVGSRGKNTCVYVGEYKSWVVLGELLTDLELDPDEPAPLDMCGECDECVKACPTGAICEPYVVDVRICLSHITQSKGFIPEWLREKMGTRIYGCDTCQSACPLNRDAVPGNIDVFCPSRGLGAHPELLPLLNISPQEFKLRVALTTVGWIRRIRFRRNAAIALGNIGDPAAVPGLIEAVSDPEPVIRGHAAWSLGRIGTREARVGLENALARETNADVLEEIRRSLDASGGC